MGFEWEIIKCNNCGRVHAMPINDFHRVYDDTCSSSTCPYCKKSIGLYDAREGVMNADRGIVIETKYILK